MEKTIKFQKIKKSQREKGRTGQNNGRYISLKEAGFFSKILISSGKTRDPIPNLLQVTVYF